MQVDATNHIRMCGYCDMLFVTKDEYQHLCDECKETLEKSDEVFWT